MSPSLPERIRVVIVDDHELVRVGLRTLLSLDSTIEVVGDAASGAEAITLAREHQPDIVLLDARLPDLAGPEVCRQLRAVLPNGVVAMLTTFTDEDLIRDCIQAGAQGYLLKDIAQFDLRGSIRALASGQAVIDPRVASVVLAAARHGSGTGEQNTPLSVRHQQVLELVARGLSNREIGARMSLSELTVKSYVEEILQLLGARNRVHAAMIATKHHWIQGF